MEYARTRALYNRAYLDIHISYKSFALHAYTRVDRDKYPRFFTARRHAWRRNVKYCYARFTAVSRFSWYHFIISQVIFSHVHVQRS
jgi:hypothetical protein